jgi:uncharacterized DUF497 family protein
VLDDEEDIFIWDDSNMEHIARHGVLPEETEEAFWDDDRLPFRLMRNSSTIKGGHHDETNYIQRRNSGKYD